MSLRADLSFNWSMVATSVLIAVSAAAAALWIAFNISKTSHRFAAACIMGLAVCAMHYTGMAAADFVCVASKSSPAWTIGGIYLSTLVFATIGLVLVLLLWNLLGRVSETTTAPLKKS
ncbi:hypothetical protein LP414_26505 [Polaromonas sp. P1(28)-13]|nr:hypothetical protein LP416_24725 [Polaromonas sp. P2-4]UUZ75325.1 hypothetical protein LP414_26505 [Polaromonas sp. P1(28)-13]